MLARIHVLCAGTFLTIGIAACASAPAGSLRQAPHVGRSLPITATSRIIDAERIQRSGSQSALDAIRAFVPGYRSLETRASATGGLGITSASRGSLRVLVDGHPIGDLETLRMVLARDILAIHVLNAPDAMMRFGPGFNGGAIVIQTVGSLRPLE